MRFSLSAAAPCDEPRAPSHTRMHAHSQGKKRVGFLPRLVNAGRAVAGISRFVGSCIRVLSLLCNDYVQCREVITPDAGTRPQVITPSPATGSTYVIAARSDLRQQGTPRPSQQPAHALRLLRLRLWCAHNRDDARVAPSNEVYHVQLRKGPGECA